MAEQEKSIGECVASLDQFNHFMEPYADSMAEVERQLEHLGRELQCKYDHQVIHTIQKRLKTLESIQKKLKKRGLDDSFSGAKENLTDIAGIRVVCTSKKDIYTLVELVKERSNFIIIKEKDYIKNPKPNGYSSFHLLVGVMAYGLEGIKSYYPVEIQLRTIAMDYWASIEHQLCYKKPENEHAERREELKEIADILDTVEERMENMMQ